MGVDVDEPRRHHQPSRVDHLAGAVGGDAGGDGSDLAIGDRQGGRGLDVVGRVDEAAALESQIEHHVASCLLPVLSAGDRVRKTDGSPHFGDMHVDRTLR